MRSWVFLSGQQHRLVARIVIQRPGVDQRFVNALEVAQPGVEATADDGLGDAVTALRQSAQAASVTCGRDLG